MENSKKNLAEESKKIQKLREKLRKQLGVIEQRVLEYTLENKNIKPQEKSTPGLDVIQDVASRK